jgi:tetraacyldisaccharide-1-P 4'-kinase
MPRLRRPPPLVTTEKDAVRLPAAARRGALADLLTLPVSIAFEDGTAVDRLLDRLVDGTLAPQEDRP